MNWKTLFLMANRMKREWRNEWKKDHMRLWKMYGKHQALADEIKNRVRDKETLHQNYPGMVQIQDVDAIIDDILG